MAIVVPRAVHRFTVAEYQRLAEAGILPSDCRTELEDGVIVDMSPIGHEHAHMVDLIAALLNAAGISINALKADTYLRIQQPVEVDDFCQYQPDLSVVRGPLGRYADRLPHVADTLLVVEVADTTLERDLGEKLSGYQQAGFPLIVVVNVPDRSVHRIERRDGAADYQHVVLTGDAEWYPAIRVRDIFAD